MKTYSPKASEIERTWYIVDASGQTLGRLASEVAILLQGKHKPGYASHIDGGDVVVVTNASKIKITGNKLEAKKYYRHSGYPGGIKEASMSDKMANDPAWVLRHAVEGMLPKNRLQDERMKRLKVYAGSDHPHAPQQPKMLELGKKKPSTDAQANKETK